MKDEDIFELAETHGWQDDFGRWNFNDDGLVAFVLSVQRTEREECAKLCFQDTGLPMQLQTLKIIRAERNWIAANIRARGET